LEDCLEIDKYLLNDVPVSVKLTKTQANLAIMAADKTKEYKFEISDLHIKMRMVTVTPGVLIGHSEALKKNNAIYAYKKSTMWNQSVAQGETLVNVQNIPHPPLPSRLLLGIVSAKAYNGAYDKNCFNFQHHHVGSISLVVNDKEIGGKALEVNFNTDTGRKFANAYSQIFTTTGKDGRDVGNDIKLSEFPDGYCLFCFNLEPTNQPGKYFNLVKKGFVRLSMTFSKPLEETVVLVLYSEQQDMFQIDAARNVITTTFT